MKLLLLLAALTTTTLAKPFFKSYLFGPPAAPDAEALCTLLFYPLEGWVDICPQHDDNDNDEDDDDDESLLGLGVKIPFFDIKLRADGSAVPKP